MEPPESYTIDVCMRCGRQAVYPFLCGHRSSTERWTVPLHVKPTGAARTLLRKMMRKFNQGD